MYACNGILFNHESPRRGRTFVTRKISRAVAEIHLGVSDCIYLGNLDAKRDWGHAKDYIEGMWLMLQQDEPEDFVLASGETHPVREFVEKAFSHVGIQLRWVIPHRLNWYFRWEGKEDNEIGICTKSGRTLVKVDPRYYRPTEVELLHGDPSKAQEKLGWKRKVDFPSLVEEMVKADIESLQTPGINQN